MRCEDGDLVAERLQANRSIYDQPLCASNPKVGMEEHDPFLFRISARHSDCAK